MIHTGEEQYRHEKTDEQYEHGSWTFMCKNVDFCQNSNSSTKINIFLEQIDHIERRNLHISNDLLQIYTFWSLSSPTFSLIISGKKCGQFKSG